MTRYPGSDTAAISSAELCGSREWQREGECDLPRRPWSNSVYCPQACAEERTSSQTIACLLCLHTPRWMSYIPLSCICSWDLWKFSLGSTNFLRWEDLKILKVEIIETPIDSRKLILYCTWSKVLVYCMLDCFIPILLYTCICIFSFNCFKVAKRSRLQRTRSEDTACTNKETLTFTRHPSLHDICQVRDNVCLLKCSCNSCVL